MINPSVILVEKGEGDQVNELVAVSSLEHSNPYQLKTFDPGKHDLEL